MNREALKIFAMVTMVWDHVCFIWFPESPWFRIPGKMCFVVYAYLIATGYLLTSDKKKYFLRILMLAAVSQIPYMLFIPAGNILFSYLISLGVIFFAEKKRYKTAILLAAVSAVLPVDGKFYAVLLPVIFWIAETKSKWLGIVLSVILVFVHAVVTGDDYAPAGLFALLVIRMAPDVRFRLPAWLWRYFYPVQWTALKVGQILF